MGTGTNQLDSNLFYILTNSNRSDTGLGRLQLLDSNCVVVRLRQSKTHRRPALYNRIYRTWKRTGLHKASNLCFSALSPNRRTGVPHSRQQFVQYYKTQLHRQQLIMQYASAFGRRFRQNRSMFVVVEKLESGRPIITGTSSSNITV